MGSAAVGLVHGRPDKRASLVDLVHASGTTSDGEKELRARSFFRKCGGLADIGGIFRSVEQNTKNVFVFTFGRKNTADKSLFWVASKIVFDFPI
jgi:hypothetical protein